MTFKLTLTLHARRDLIRLQAFLADKSRTVAVEASGTIGAAIASLQTLPNRGRQLSDGRRELAVKFGHYGYAIEYRVIDQTVLVGRVRHMREQR